MTSSSLLVHVTTKGRKPTGADCRQTFSKNFEKLKKFENFSVLAGGAKPPQTHPLNGRSSHLIEAAKRGRLDQMILFLAPLTTQAPPTIRGP